MNQDYREYGLKTYEVVVEEIRQVTYRVRALTADEAIDNINEGIKIDDVDNGVELVSVTEVV